MSEISYIDAGRIISTLNRSVLTVETTLRCLDKMEDLNFSRQIETLVEAAHQFEVREEKWRGMVDDTRALIKRDLRDNRAITLNWGLVTLWSSFEALLEDVLLLWFTEDNRAFLSWGGKTSINFEEIKQADDAAAIKARYFEKAIRAFTSDSIEDRIRTLKQKFNISEEILFSRRLANDSIKARLGSWGPATLSEISNKRNKIVHRLALPLAKLEELQTIEIMLERFLLNIASIIGGKLDRPVLAFHVAIPPLT
jgi:hypothetical protein